MKRSSAFAIYNHQYKRRNFSNTKIVEDQLDEDFAKARKLIHFTRVINPSSDQSDSSKLNIVHYSRPDLTTSAKSSILKPASKRCVSVSLPKLCPKPEDSIRSFPLDKTDNFIHSKIDKYFKQEDLADSGIKKRFASTYSSMDLKNQSSELYTKIDPKLPRRKVISNFRSATQLIKVKPTSMLIRNHRSPTASKLLVKYDEMSVELDKLFDKASIKNKYLDGSPEFRNTQVNDLKLLEKERRVWKKLRKTNKNPFISLNDIKKNADPDQEFMIWISDILTELKE